jgi:cytochrome c-type biogenesis protein CcmH/NrfF
MQRFNFRQRVAAAFAAIVLTGISLAQTSSGIMTPDGRRVAMRLACLCGSCKNTVAECPMIHCHYSEPAREKIAMMQAAGADDQTIIDAFVKEEGKQALAVPPTEGFSLLAWWMPGVALATGLAGVYLVIRRYLRPAATPPNQIDPALLARYQDQIDKDLQKLE